MSLAQWKSFKDTYIALNFLNINLYLVSGNKVLKAKLEDELKKEP